MERLIEVRTTLKSEVCLMTKIYPLSDFIEPTTTLDDSLPTYWYEGRCPQSQTLFRLPRTATSEAIAYGLMQQLAADNITHHEGKMYGILIVEQGILKAFSGLLNGRSEVEGWVPPIPRQEDIVLIENETLIQLENLKQELLYLESLPERLIYKKLQQEWVERLQQLTYKHQQNKQKRQEQRQQSLDNLALEELREQSRREGIEKRKLKQQREQELKPFQEIIIQADERIEQLKKQRQSLSRQLQEQLYTSYSLTNFLGQSTNLKQLMTTGLMPTGTGECCAPKLLNYAATHNLKPLAMAEFWWGPGQKVSGQFYGACLERCQPLMGFLLSGCSRKEMLDIVYEDDWLLIVNKPTGLLSVPGRYRDNQDSVVSRLGREIKAVHRLDRDTSGLLLLAKDLSTYRHLSLQFQARTVDKVYEALLAGLVQLESGTINLPLWGNPDNRPYQTVDWQRGKPSLTHFQVIRKEDNYTRMQFIPTTGRSHQIRVHSASSQGLGIPILGDRLYNTSIPTTSRLYLHAREIAFNHPQLNKRCSFQVVTPF